MKTQNTEHTPGPWKAHGTHIYTTEKHANSAPGHADAERLVAACPDTECGSEYTAKENLPEYEEASANAQLIAAAPEMLVIVQSLIDEDSDGLDRSAWRRNAARAAIAKAKGAA